MEGLLSARGAALWLAVNPRTAQLLEIDTLRPEHQIQQPNLVTRMTPYGDLTRLGSQVEMSKTPEFWTDPFSCRWDRAGRSGCRSQTGRETRVVDT
jgi:hypothetical protein